MDFPIERGIFGGGGKGATTTYRVGEDGEQQGCFPRVGLIGFRSWIVGRERCDSCLAFPPGAHHPLVGRRRLGESGLSLDGARVAQSFVRLLRPWSRS